MFKKTIVFICIILSVVPVITGCGKRESESTSDVRGDNPAQMPDIVFMNTITDSDDSYKLITFYDKNGNQYTSTDTYVCSLGYKKLVNAYVEGDLADKITFHANCDVNQIYDNYKKLLEVSQRKDYQIVYPEMLPDVEDSIYQWYGIYYDENGQLSILELHRKERMVHLEANDERANEIYDWYIKR